MLHVTSKTATLAGQNIERKTFNYRSRSEVWPSVDPDVAPSLENFISIWRKQPRNKLSRHNHARLTPTPRHQSPHLTTTGSQAWHCYFSACTWLIVWFTTNGMCVKKTPSYVWREQAIVRETATHDLYCCLLPQCEASRTCRSGFPIASGERLPTGVNKFLGGANPYADKRIKFKY